MEKTKILVTGANGQLGRELQAISAALTPNIAITSNLSMISHNSPYEFIFFDRATLSIADPDAIHTFLTRERPAYCINCAAYTAVDKAESEKESAFLINGDAVGYLAAACHETGVRLIHISTDYVFDGLSETPLREDDPTDPINVYGASKLEGERQALQRHPHGTLIIRTSWVYSEFGNNFVRTMIRLMKERPSINVVSDQVGSPTYAADLAAAILHIVAAPSFIPGLYHYSNEGRISWYEFALAIRGLIGSACEVHPIPTDQYPTPAKRPRFSLLDKSLIRSTYHLTIPEWRHSLVTCIAKMRP
jgi:dTDP-4-dehydrorhamnose reductase